MVVNGIMFRTRTGCPWRDLPGEYGNWKTAYNRHRRWSLDGTWQKILDRLRAGCDEAEGPDWTLSADSTVVRATSTLPEPGTSCPRSWPQGALPNDKNLPARAVREALGRSRGGLSTKIHLAADRRCRPVTRHPDPGPARRLPAVHPAAEPGPHRPPRQGPAPHPARHRDGRQGVLLRGQPRLPAQARDHRGHPGQGRPEETPPQPRPAADGRLPSTPHGTRSAIPSSAASASSSSSAPSPPATTNATTCTRPPSTSPRSGSGYETPSNDLRDTP